MSLRARLIALLFGASVLLRDPRAPRVKTTITDGFSGSKRA